MKFIEAREGKIYYDGAEVLSLRFEEYEERTDYYVGVRKPLTDYDTEWTITPEEFNRLAQLGVMVVGE